MGTRAKAKPKTKAAGPDLKTVIPPGLNAPMSLQAVAAALQVSKRKVADMIRAGDFPGPELYVGQNPRWTVAGVNSWVEAQKAKPRPERLKKKMEV